MAFSKSTRILILLTIDTIFFLIELITGYSINSLALIADSFHMLNDVLSLCVGLWAVKVANQKSSSKNYTYGWQRAETLGALVNGVFLVALCVTIFLDAIERFVKPNIVTAPKLMLIIGCLGLVSNVLGLVLFHDHSHGGHGHGGHSQGDHERAAEEGHAPTHGDEEQSRVDDQTGNVQDVLPQTRVGGYHGAQSGSDDSTVVTPSSPIVRRTTSGSRSRQRKHSRSHSRAYSVVDDIPITPNAFRKSIQINASLLDEVSSDDDEGAVADDEHDSHDHPQQPLLANGKQSKGYGALLNRKSIDHKDHYHAQPKDSGKSGHGHSHKDLNMRGIFLHVMGDALGNIGVIASGLVIWLTDFSWRFYFDPAISLVITCIILASAIPLCKAASRILLQAVPSHIDVDHIREDIEDLPGIVGCHEVHIWQLSDIKLVASLHVQVDFDFKGEGSTRYMELAQAIRKCLHEYGIHSTTIQPEFCLDPDHDHGPEAGVVLDDNSPTGSGKRSKFGSRVPSKAASVCETNCLLECGDNCGPGKKCCGQGPKDGHEGHDHEH